MPERISVAQMVYNFHIEKGGGGVTRTAIEIATALDPTQFSVSVVSLGFLDTQDEQKRLKQLNEQGIRAFAATSWNDEQPYKSFFRAYQSLKAEFSRHPVDILHSHSEFTDVAAIFLKLQKTAPFAMRTTHYGYAVEWHKRPLRRALFTNFLFPLLFDLEIGVSPALQDRLKKRKMAHLSNKKALFINVAINLKRFQNVQVNISEKRRSLGIPEDALLIGSVGRLAEQKGYTYLLQAAERVAHAQPDAFFLLIGDGPLAEELKTQAVDLGLQKRVVFTGSRTDVEELLACLDLFVLPSLWEGTPACVLESMASGIPVIATDIPGSRDLIRHGENGWLAPPADPAALSQAILELLALPSTRNSLAQKARTTVQDYSFSTVASRYAALYQALYQTASRKSLAK